MSFVRAVMLLKSAGAERVPHSGGTLYGHLFGVYNILRKRSCPDHVCMAGLFHSVYGTSFFKGNIFNDADRPRVREAIGDDAERLAWIFCKLDRTTLHPDVGHVRSVDGEQILVDRADRTALHAIMKANTEEQSPRLQRKPDRLFPTDILLGLEKAGRFDGDAWPEDIIRHTGPVERLAGLINYSFDDLVAMPRFQAKAFRVENGATKINIIPQGHEPLFYNDGWTIYWHSLHNDEIDTWINALDEELDLVKGATRVSAFASKRGPGLRPHYDLNDNFVCQAQGTKRWRVGPPTVRYPTIGYTLGDKMSPAQEAELTDAPPMILDTQVEMNPGSVMFMPRGYWHDTETVSDESLHFNIQCGLATWKDLIQFILNETPLLHAEPLRAPIRHLGADPEILLEQLQNALSQAKLPAGFNVNMDDLCRFISRRRSA